MKKFLNKTFNLAGLLRGFLTGVTIGLLLFFLIIIIGGLKVIESDAISFIFYTVTFLPAIILAILKARSSPAKISEGIKRWVDSTRSVTNLSFAAGSGFADSLFPEQITIKRFLIETI